jgi:hypothetical protein
MRRPRHGGDRIDPALHLQPLPAFPRAFVHSVLEFCLLTKQLGRLWSVSPSN